MRAVLLFMLAAAPAALIAHPQRDTSTEAYLALIVRYAWGEHARVTAELGQWSLEALQPALRDLPVVLPVVSRRNDVSEATLIATAAVVHVDLARRANTHEEVDRNLALGKRLLDLLPNGDAKDGVAPFRARWHHAAGTVLSGFSRPHEARVQFESARSLRPGDSRILVALGSANEVEGAVLASHRGSESSATRPGSPQDEPAPERLNLAMELYEAALVAAPDFDEARLRLARTQLLTGLSESAAATLDPLLKRVTRGHVGYLAWLIGGGISEALGRSDDAIARYREARTLCRRCPSALMGLSHALLRRGNREEARELVGDVVTDDEWPPPGDPWWAYQQGQWYEVDTVLEQLRREVPK